MKEVSMFLKRVGTGLALLVAGAFYGAGAQAAPVGGAPNTNVQIDPHAMVEKAQVFFWRNRRYCFYWDAWNGPGWYYCGYAWRRGYGWGGSPGWHGWRHHDRSWHRRNRGWDRGDRRSFDRGDRRSFDRGDRRGRVERPGRSDRGVRGDRSGGRGESFRGSGRSDGGGRGMSSGRSGGSSGGPSVGAPGGGRGGDGGRSR
jgi:hypothetical protein